MCPRKGTEAVVESMRKLLRCRVGWGGFYIQGRVIRIRSVEMHGLLLGDGNAGLGAFGSRVGRGRYGLSAFDLGNLGHRRRVRRACKRPLEINRIRSRNQSIGSDRKRAPPKRLGLRTKTR